MFGGVRFDIAVAVLLLLGGGCDHGAVADRPNELGSDGAKEAPTAKTSDKESELREGIVLGEFTLSNRPVVDGDTIRVEGLDRSIRLLGIDTEEKAKRDERKRMESDFEGHLRRQRGNSRRPVRAATPMGDEATAFAETFFDAGDVVRLERDDPKTLRGGFGRPLAYVFVQSDGRWTSYNVEAVRAGMSPYFTKYGYSQRFHQQFARAEEEARDAQRGIWDPSKKHYDDYAERKAWWNARADFIQAFEHAGAGRDDHVILWRTDASTRLETRLDRETFVLGVVEEIQRFKGLVRVFLRSAGKRDFPIIFKGYAVFERSGVADEKGEPVSVRGKVERYTKGQYETLQIVVTDPSQVAIPDLPPLRETKPSDGR